MGWKVPYNYFDIDMKITKFGNITNEKKMKIISSIKYKV